MRTVEEIKEEIAIQEREYNKMLDIAINTPQLERDIYIKMKDKHELIKEVLLWVLDEKK